MSSPTAAAPPLPKCSAHDISAEEHVFSCKMALAMLAMMMPAHERPVRAAMERDMKLISNIPIATMPVEEVCVYTERVKSSYE